MIVEYTVSGRIDVEGNGWVCYSRELSNVTAVFDELIFSIRQNKELNFDQIGQRILDNYKKKTSRAKADITVYEDAIDICKPNRVLPHIWIVKKMEG